MSTRAALLMLPLLALAACGTPQEQCQRYVSRQVKTLDGLIAQTRADLARGYSYRTELRDDNFDFGFGYCSYGYPGIGWCMDNRRPDTVRRAVPIDPEAEQRKLDLLLDRRQQMAAHQCPAVVTAAP